MVERQELVSSRGKTLACLALCLGFVAIAALLPHDGGDPSERWPCGGLSGLGAAAFNAYRQAALGR